VAAEGFCEDLFEGASGIFADLSAGSGREADVAVAGREARKGAVGQRVIRNADGTEVEVGVARIGEAEGMEDKTEARIRTIEEENW
jgi:hypothetical protein